MNIREAKEEIISAMRAYMSRNGFGEYDIPIEHQRPVFLVGPPGVGKTEIMHQIAGELGVPLVSYSMTHHTRQSALGLPFIVQEEFGGETYDVSEYTMSEILAEVYRASRDTGNREGILFLDEINCVSETLAPAMLQFLQYKIFGRHRVPDGWIVVTAGNPPEYNSSVREFDIATRDRLKRIEVEPDFEAWKEYAHHYGIHPSVITYLEIHKGNFYKIESTVDGKQFVTARGWSDLSDMIRLYEKLGMKVQERLIGQYIQNAAIARDFAVYYDLYNKYKADYGIGEILSGTQPEEIGRRAASASFDERLAVLSLLLDALDEEFREIDQCEATCDEYRKALTAIRTASETAASSVLSELDIYIRMMKKEAALARKNSNRSRDDLTPRYRLLAILEEQAAKIRQNESAHSNGMEFLAAEYGSYRRVLREDVERTGRRLENVFDFIEKYFGADQEMAIFVTELTVGNSSAHFIARHGSEKYYEHNRQLLFYERNREIIRELDHLALEDQA